MEKAVLPSELETEIKEKNCYHCGLPCEETTLEFDEKIFCCSGCQAVYSILKENDLCTYYQLPDAKGISPDRNYYEGKYNYLDLPEVRDKVITFSEGDVTQVNWYIPSMHCSSCIWLLENLHKLNPAVVAAQVDFPEKTVRISVNEKELSLSGLANLITSIGYEPYISLNDIEVKKRTPFDRSRIYKIGIAGFAFGNIMLLGLSDYFTLLGSTGLDREMEIISGVLSIVLALPVFFYCSSDFFVSAWKAIKTRTLNIDAPIALAIFVTFARSLVEITSGGGAGYLDSMTGIVFFMLVGRYFQDKSYSLISFDRDYRSFFPVAVSVIEEGEEVKKQISDLEIGDVLLIRSNEMIPCDGRLMAESTSIDYSFVSGESVPVVKTVNNPVYAGGKIRGAAVEIEVTKKVTQSYLTRLWNNDVFTKAEAEEESKFTAFINRYFTLAVFLIGSVSWIIWAWMGDFKRGFDAMTTVWIIACPCALLLAHTFTNGNLLALLRKSGFYLKNALVLDRLAQINTVVFDKTGTLTLPDSAEVRFQGTPLTPREKLIIADLTGQSGHPLSKLVHKQLVQEKTDDSLILRRTDFSEQPGGGLEALYGGVKVKLGSAEWVGSQIHNDHTEASRVFVSFDDKVRGYFEINSRYRKGLGEAIADLKSQGLDSYLLSGDKPTDTTFLSRVFGGVDKLYFSQTPQSKLDFIQKLQNEEGKTVLMLGDGLNDAGALKQSDVGVAVSDNMNNFTPASDAILEGNRVAGIRSFIDLAKSGRQIITLSFAISVIYNVIGLYFAVQGLLKPVVAAILMPASSFSIILFTSLVSRWKAKRLLKAN